MKPTQHDESPSNETEASSHKQNKKKTGKMGTRGVARPMATHHQMKSHHTMGKPYSDERKRLLQVHHKQTLWVYWSVVLLGFWTMLSPLTFGYETGLVQPAGGREVWLSMDARITAMSWSDIISGALLVILGWRSLTPNRPYSLWACCFVGVWLTMAPLIFWSPSAAAYLNDTFVGAWVIALTILVAGMPNMILYMEMGPSTPPGWSYNPSSWPQRWIMIATGFMGWVVSRYLAAYQLGYISNAWDPFFGASTAAVLTSDMSRSLPISDAGLGTVAYTFEFLMGFMGGPSRWRTMPWMVTFFGILVIPLGLVHIFLVISQPIVVGAWCTFCLLAAAIMLPMIPLEADEVIAMGQYIKRAKNRGESVWKVFWKGGSDPEEEQGRKDQRSPELIELSSEPGKVLKASLWGMSVPWNLLLASLLGLWLTVSPAVFSADGMSADIMHVAGLLVFSFSVLAMGEILRACRFLNILLGLSLIVASFVVPTGAATQVHNILLGLLIAAVSLPRGIVKEQYGTWQSLVR
jgi:uncharacterized membrane protein